MIVRPHYLVLVPRLLSKRKIGRASVSKLKASKARGGLEERLRRRLGYLCTYTYMAGAALKWFKMIRGSFSVVLIIMVLFVILVFLIIMFIFRFPSLVISLYWLIDMGCNRALLLKLFPLSLVEVAWLGLLLQWRTCLLLMDLFLWFQLLFDIILS